MLTQTKVDFKREYPDLYHAKREPQLIEVPPLTFLMVDGHGEPGTSPETSPEFTGAIEALYSVAYTVKFAVRKQEGLDYVVMPLEGLWWTNDGSRSPRDGSGWNWTLMIMQPHHASEELVAQAIAEIARKKELPAIERMRREELHEGHAAQVLHVGPYAAEAETSARLEEFIAASGLHATGLHHEIYLSDPSRTEPDRLRTILRQPVRARE